MGLAGARLRRLAEIGALALLVGATGSVGTARASGPAEPVVPRPPSPADYRLTVQAPPECPDVETIRGRVLSLLSGPPIGEGTMDVEVLIEPIASGYAMELATAFAGQQGRRTLTAERCAELTDAVAIVVAVALEPGLEPPSPEATARPPAPASEPPATAVPPIDPVEVARPPEPRPTAPASAPGSNARPRPIPALRLAVGPEHGALPRTTFALHAAVGLAWPKLRLELRGTHLLPRRHEAPAGFVALYQQGAVAMAACARARLGRAELPLCGGMEAGALRADSRGALPSQTRHGAWLGPLVGAGYAQGGRRWGGWVSGEVVLRVLGARVVVDDVPAFGSGLVSLRLVAGIEIFLQ